MKKVSTKGVQRHSISISNWWLLVRLVETEKCIETVEFSAYYKHYSLHMTVYEWDKGK